MSAYYNENDPRAAAWLRELIRAGLIAPGEVDERDIRDVCADDLRGFRQHHFFAGIGVWSYSLRRAGWADDRPVWTGSCPCQPFSAAGGRAGFADERHLWPSWFRLIQDFKPQTVFGEQVASRAAIGGQPTDDLRALWHRQELLGLCENWLEANSPLGLQGMPERSRAGVASVQAIIDAIESESLDRWRKSESGKSRASVRSDGGVADEETGSRRVRDERASVQHDGESQLEHAVARSDQSIGGLHDEEHAGRVVRGERSVRELGRGDVSQSCAHDLGRTAQALRRVIERTSGSLKEADGESWLNTVQSQMERAGYAFGALDLCAAGFGAPHIRQRSYFVGVAAGGRREREWHQPAHGIVVQAGANASVMADSDSRQRGRVADGEGCERDGQAAGRIESDGELESGCVVDGMGDAESSDRRLPVQSGRQDEADPESFWSSAAGPAAFATGPTNGFWRDADWLRCRDERWRPVEPGTFPLVDGSAARVGRLRGYGNAIVAEVATAFIEAAMSEIEE